MNKTTFQIGDKVARRTGSKTLGTVLTVDGDDVRVRWQSGARVGGGEFSPVTWTKASALKVPGTSGTAHQAWCKTQGKRARELYRAWAKTQPVKQSGSSHMVWDAGVVPSEWDAVSRGIVRSKDLYDRVIQALEAIAPK